MRWLALIVVPAMCLSSCGSDSGGSANAGVSKPEFIRRADALCAGFNDKYNRLSDAISNGGKVPAASGGDQLTADALNKQADVLNQEVTALGQLQKPKGDAATVQKFLDGLTQEAALDQAEAGAWATQDYNGASTIRDQFDSLESTTSGISTGYGFQECE